MSTALAIFVKTPNVSPVKTRLAQEIGTEKALEFYQLSLRATEALALVLKQKNPTLNIYWAVAEKEEIHSHFWEKFPTIYQGEGSLGERLSNVYDELLLKHENVFFMGADSPHLNVDIISEYLSSFCSENHKKMPRFLLGKTLDGGFYLFGGNSNIERELWTSVKYSSEVTFTEFYTVLNSLGVVSLVEGSFDIDYLDDFSNYNEELFSTKGLLTEQISLIKWSLGIKKLMG